jgi:O-methyltransferase involved in polyketide biosynthesis
VRTAVALGEGLETQFWRVDNGRCRWLTVDVPEARQVRERLLERGERQPSSRARRSTRVGWTRSTIPGAC